MPALPATVSPPKSSINSINSINSPCTIFRCRNLEIGVVVPKRWLCLWWLRLYSDCAFCGSNAWDVESCSEREVWGGWAASHGDLSAWGSSPALGFGVWWCLAGGVVVASVNIACRNWRSKESNCCPSCLIFRGYRRVGGVIDLVLEVWWGRAVRPVDGCDPKAKARVRARVAYRPLAVGVVSDVMFGICSQLCRYQNVTSEPRLLQGWYGSRCCSGGPS